MQRENVWFLVGGVVLGILIAAITMNAVGRDPIVGGQGAGEVVEGPAGPRARTETGAAAPADGAAPMVAEMNALKQRVQDNPQDVASMVRLANLYHQVQMWNDAIPFYEMALEIQTDDPDLMSDLGICFRSVQRPDD
ncbi:MAG: tetratricopeptide repeat-containing protein, partial [Acidobacteriota bacterium]|nr:tetratricopeptide repeat-containing protein [Acidobacteriota bacterium]